MGQIVRKPAGSNPITIHPIPSLTLPLEGEGNFEGMSSILLVALLHQAFLFEEDAKVFLVAFDQLFKRVRILID